MKNIYKNPIHKILDHNSRVMAKDLFIDNNTQATGLNNNDLIIGASGCGKTRSYVIPNILHTDDSMIIVDTKNSLYKNYAPSLSKRGYTIWNLNLAKSKNSSIGYNPLRFVRKTLGKSFPYSRQDVEILCSYLCFSEFNKEPFWDLAARMYLTAYISYVLEALPENEQHLGTVAKLLNMPEADALFWEWELAYPDSFATKKWKLFKDCTEAGKTVASIQMNCNEKLATFQGNSIQRLFSHPEQIDFGYMSNHKTALFINVSDTDRSCDKLLNLLYSQAFHQLCQIADDSYEGRLRIPVRIILDDFAANAVILDFDKIISVIRSREIYVSIILQSLTQLYSIYGENAAKTIINNCDNCLYLGGQDVTTAHYVAKKANVPPNKILNLPLGDAYLFVRGQTPRQVMKYDLETDSAYQSIKSPVSIPDSESLDVQHDIF